MGPVWQAPQPLGAPGLAPFSLRPQFSQGGEGGDAKGPPDHAWPLLPLFNHRALIFPATNNFPLGSKRNGKSKAGLFTRPRMAAERASEHLLISRPGPLPVPPDPTSGPENQHRTRPPTSVARPVASTRPAQAQSARQPRVWGRGWGRSGSYRCAGVWLFVLQLPGAPGERCTGGGTWSPTGSAPRPPAQPVIQTGVAGGKGVWG